MQEKNIKNKKSLKIIKKLCKTHNTDLLKDLDPEVKTILHKLSKKVLKTGKGFIGLAYIINNYLESYKIPKYYKIYGAYSITHLVSKKYNKDVWIFGDIHTLNKCRDPDAKSIVNYIIDNIKYT